MTVTFLENYGNSIAINFDDGSRVLCYKVGANFHYPQRSVETVKYLQEISSSLIKVSYKDGVTQLAFKSSTNNFYIVSATEGGGDGPPPDPTPAALKDYISPGHHVTEGTTVLSSWTWHLNNNGNRGGDDWNYAYGTAFKAPGKGTVRHFDVSGVGMCVVLKLDTPADRTKTAYAHDANGPMTDIWFEHCSSAIDGDCEQGDVIGHSGNGYGQYAAHLHVHGLVDNGNSAGSTNRCCFWNFL